MHHAFPPPSLVEPAELPETPSPGRQRHPVLIAVIAAAVGAALGVAVGFGFGTFVIATNDCPPSDGWCELGAGIVGLFFGALAGIVTYVVAGVATIRRLRPKGRRAGLIGTHILLPGGFLLLAAILGAISEAVG